VRIDSGDHEVGYLRWRFWYAPDLDPEVAQEALSAAVVEYRDQVCAAPSAAVDPEAALSLSAALDALPVELLARHGLAVPDEELHAEVEFDDMQLETFTAG
jgi:hypothetical protein